ncbi:MAG: lipoate--protein ligase family protein [Candidatus Hodarchaeales archaeon]|jgi:lipoate-protein ligase A
MKNSFYDWDLVFLGPIDSVYTQSLWHAAAQLRSSGEINRNLLAINWPTYPIVSCGYHQAVSQVVDLEYCKEKNLQVIRRAVGGGAVYLDSTQLFYHFVWHNETPYIPKNVNGIFQTLLKPVVKTYRDLGVEAEYKPVNDILAHNRKISGNGAGMFDSANVLVGNFILDFPREEMARILRVPDEKFRDKVFKSLQAGISSFKDELGYIPERKDIIKSFKSNLEDILDINFIESNLDPKIQVLMEELKTQYLTDEWRNETDIRGKRLIEAVKIHSSRNVSQGMFKSEGGLIRAICEFEETKILDILLSGDFWITPGKLPKLEEKIKGLDLSKEDLTARIQAFIEKERCDTAGTTSQDIAQAIQNSYDVLTK